MKIDFARTRDRNIISRYINCTVDMAKEEGVLPSEILSEDIKYCEWVM